MKKKLIVAATAGALTLAAGSAFALENEFHGMYKFIGMETNMFTGQSANGQYLAKDAHSGWYAENRARLQYIAKANDNLKLVTTFELDARFGGQAPQLGYKGTTGSDSGGLDADNLTLETKSMYLDFNCPLTGTNMKVGIQPWADSYQSLFLLADMTGVYASKGFGPVTTSGGWFRFDDNTIARTGGDPDNRPGQLTADLFVLDGKFAINKDMKVGASYYYVHNDLGPTTTTPVFAAYVPYKNLHMLGVNADLTFGPANLKPFAAYQMGDVDKKGDYEISAYGLGLVGSVKAGPGKVNFAAVYLSGDDDTTDLDLDGWQNIADATTYFNAANMWLIIENGAWTNGMAGVTGRDLNVGDRGLMGIFAGYEGTMDKIFYSANIGYAQTAEQRKNAGKEEESTIGTEINATIGYKLFDNLSLSGTAAYAFLGKGLTDDGGKRIGGATGLGANDADDPYMLMTMLSYTF